MTKKAKTMYLLGGAIVLIAVMLVAFLAFAAGGGGKEEKLIFLSGTAEKQFDGTPLVCEEWSLLSGNLKEGHSAVVTVTASRTETGVSPNTFEVVIVDNKGKDVTATYTVERRTGELRVTGLLLVIKTEDATKEYDGKPLTANGYEILSGQVDDYHNLMVQVTGERTDAGISDNIFVVTVEDNEGKNVTAQYAIERVHGKLEVTKKQINIFTPSAVSVYDGTPLECKEWYYAADSRPLDGHIISVTVNASRTDAGVTNNSATVVIKDGDKNVTANYEIICVEGELVVLPRKITIRSESGQKEYDGTPLKNPNWEYASQTIILEGHAITVVISGSRTPPGESKNTIAQVSIFDGEGREISFNYEVTKQEGALVVTGDGGSSGTGSGSGGGNLNESGKIEGGTPQSGEDESEVVVRVYADVSGQIYLRYMSFGDYNGSGWGSAADYPYLIDSKYSLNYLTGIALKKAGFQSQAVTVEVNGSNYLLPYYLDTAALAYQIQTSDVKYTGNTAGGYSAYYYLFSFVDSMIVPPNLGAYAALENEYFDFVKANYLSVPIGTKSSLQQIIYSEGFDKNNPDIIAAVAAYIQNSAVYNMDYPRELDGQADIVVSFLRDYKEGICQHYASAATMLYRSLGIPARYVIGYAGATKGGEWAELTAKNAHAWVEVYIAGLGWIQVEVTGGGVGGGSGEGEGGGSGGSGSGGGSGAKTKLDIKPVDLFLKFENGAVLEAGKTLQGLSALLAKGYTYEVEVEGRQSTVGIGTSTIVSFVLFDPQGVDVTDQFEIKFGKGILHIYIAEISVTTEDLSKIYDGRVLASNEQGISYSGVFISGHRMEILAPTGMQTNVGKSQNTYTIKIVDKDGQDVTYMYRVKSNFGTLTVLARPIMIEAGSATKVFDGTELICPDFDVYSSEGEPLGEGDSITVLINGSQTQIGKCENIVASVQIVDKNGQDVTSNYSIEYQSGLLTVTR